MSSNLVKQIFTLASDTEKRVIDTNTLMRQRLEEFEQQKQQERKKKGFVAGLVAEEVIVSDEVNAEEMQEMQEPAPEEMMAMAQEEAERILAEAQEEANSILAEAHAQAMKTIESARAQAEVEKNRIIADAKQEGYSDGARQARAESEEIRREFEQKGQELDAYYQEQIEILEPQLVEVITDVYEHIFHVELRSYREILSFLITSTLRKIDGGHDFIIHVSKEDYPYVNMQKKQLIAGAVSNNCNVEVVEDITLAKNDCMIETENGIFDCGLGTQLDELRAKLRLLSWTKED